MESKKSGNVKMSRTADTAPAARTYPSFLPFVPLRTPSWINLFIPA